jgi:hypothetical protein
MALLTINNAALSMGTCKFSPPEEPAEQPATGGSPEVQSIAVLAVTVLVRRGLALGSSGLGLLLT